MGPVLRQPESYCTVPRHEFKGSPWVGCCTVLRQAQPGSCCTVLRQAQAGPYCIETRFYRIFYTPFCQQCWARREQKYHYWAWAKRELAESPEPHQWQGQREVSKYSWVTENLRSLIFQMSYQARLNGTLTCKQHQVSLSGMVLTTRPQPSLEVDRANSSEFNPERGTQGTYFKIHQICWGRDSS